MSKQMVDESCSTTSDSIPPKVVQTGEINELELGFETLQIQHKRFYLNVKQNQMGRYIKLVEVDSSGRKSRILIPMSITREFKNHLNTFIEHYASLGASNSDNLRKSNKIKSVISYYQKQQEILYGPQRK